MPDMAPSPEVPGKAAIPAHTQSESSPRSTWVAIRHIDDLNVVHSSDRHESQALHSEV